MVRASRNRLLDDNAKTFLALDGARQKKVRIPEKQLFEAACPAWQLVGSYNRGATIRLAFESGLLSTLAGTGATLGTDVAHYKRRSRHRSGKW